MTDTLAPSQQVAHLAFSGRIGYASSVDALVDRVCMTDRTKQRTKRVPASKATLTQRERSARTQRLLLDATIDLLVEVGYGATSTPEVARRAGLSRGAQVHHFPRKTDLVSAAVEHLAHKMRNQLLGKMEQLPNDETRLDKAMQSLWEVYRGPLFVAAMELDFASRTDPELRKARDHFNTTLVEPTLADFYNYLLGPDDSATVRAKEAVELTSQFISGLALARKTLSEEACQERLRRWTELLRPLLIDAATD